MEQRLKALQMTQELGLAQVLREAVTALASHPHPKVRSKAVSVLGEAPEASVELLMERIVRDTDSRVRANAIEVLENHQTPEFIALLAERSRTTNSRERANAIKALHRMRVGNVGPALIAMLQDARPEHRISAMWALKQIGWWKLLHEVGRIAKSDPNLRTAPIRGRRPQRRGRNGPGGNNLPLHRHWEPRNEIRFEFSCDICREALPYGSPRSSEEAKVREGKSIDPSRNFASSLLRGKSSRLAPHSKRLGTISALIVCFVCGTAATALAMPTQEEVFQSTKQNMDSTVDISKVVPYLLAGISLAIMWGLYNHHRKRQTTPGKLNSPGRLSREVCRKISLRPVEIKQLKLLADEQEIEYPLTLILCPSLLGKAIRSPGAQVDRAVVKEIVQRLKQSLEARPQTQE